MLDIIVRMILVECNDATFKGRLNYLLWKKVMRLRSLESVDRPNFESKEDTLIDLINYAAIYLSYLKRDKHE